MTKTIEYGYGNERRKYRKIGTISTGEERTWREGGETASNYVEYHMAGYQEIELYARGTETKYVVLAIAPVSVTETYYQNRVFTATSDSREQYEVGEKMQEHTFMAGYHSHLGVDLFDYVERAFNGRLQLEGYRLDVEQRGHYHTGAPMLSYKLVEVVEQEEAA
jgi:hypothetical protein